LPQDSPALWVVVLAGGIGSRFWPASTPTRPKQLLPLASPRPLIRDTVERALTLVPPERLKILAGGHLVPPFRRELTGLGDDLFWVEPRARGTGPVLAWAAHRIALDNPDTVMVSLHSDHFIDPTDAFRDVILRGARVCSRTGALITVSVPPDRPETGYGYIRRGEPLAGEDGGYHVAAFIEKPDAPTARRYLDAGYLWNSGIFIWTASRFLEEVRIHAPEIGDHLHLLDQGREGDFFETVTAISVDEAVLERSGRVGTVPATFRWDDLGSWDSLSRTRATDDAGNVVEGEAHLADARGNIVWAEDGPVAVFGVDDLVVARACGVTLVAPRDRAGELKRWIARIPEALRDRPPETSVEGVAPPVPPGRSGRQGPTSEEGE
jgi:mannose-1-phosphate guanylyltransferase